MRLVLWLLLPSLLFPSLAAGASLDLVAGRASAVASDGERYVAFVPYAGPRRLSSRLEVLDTRTGARRRLSKDPACDLQDEDTGNRGMTAAGQAVLRCFAESQERDTLIDLRSGAMRPLPGSVEVRGERQRVTWFLVGRVWAYGEVDAEATVFLDWRTGRLEQRGRDDDHRDLDDPALRRLPRPCRRFSRRRYVEDPAFYAPPSFLTGVAERSPSDGVVLRSCRGGRPTTLAHRRAGSDSGRGGYGAGLGAGLAFWYRSGLSEFPRDASSTVHGYRLASRERFSWRLPRVHLGFDEPFRVLTTRRTLFFSVTERQSCPEFCSVVSGRIYRARVP